METSFDFLSILKPSSTHSQSLLLNLLRSMTSIDWKSVETKTKHDWEEQNYFDSFPIRLFRLSKWFTFYILVALFLLKPNILSQNITSNTRHLNWDLILFINILIYSLMICFFFLAASNSRIEGRKKNRCLSWLNDVNVLYLFFILMRLWEYRKYKNARKSGSDIKFSTGFVCAFTKVFSFIEDELILRVRFLKLYSAK